MPDTFPFLLTLLFVRTKGEESIAAQMTGSLFRTDKVNVRGVVSNFTVRDANRYCREATLIVYVAPAATSSKVW
ncbi:MAG: hypothetical protein ABIU09_09215 [Pyrinomonadaceae bacterium]